jgi:hypothetical protein
MVAFRLIRLEHHAGEALGAMADARSAEVFSDGRVEQFRGNRFRAASAMRICWLNCAASMAWPPT